MDKLKGAKYFSKFDVRWVITMFKSNLVINEKQLSRQTKDYMSQQLCSLECAIPQQPFRQKYSRRKSKVI